MQHDQLYTLSNEAGLLAKKAETLRQQGQET